MIRRLIATMLVMLSACSTHSAMTPEQVLYDKVQDAIKTQNMKLLSDYEYDKIAEYMSGGQTRWIDLYPAFNKEPFLGVVSFQEVLDISMAAALPIKPLEVLKFINESNIDSICGFPFIEPTTDETHSYYLKAHSALMAHGSVNQWGPKCLSILDNTMHDIKTLRSDKS